MIDAHFYTLRSAVSLAELASELGVDLPVDGASDEMIKTPSALKDSQPGSITFFSDKRLKHHLSTAQATACLTTEELLPLVTKTGMIALTTEAPRAVFARLSGRMAAIGGGKPRASVIDKTADIHPSATLGKNVTIGPRTRIGANSVIDDGVTIGADCVIEPLVRISFTNMGDGCHIKSCTVIGGSGFGITEDAQGVFSVPHLGRVILHNEVHIGSNSCVDRGQLGDTVMCDNVKVDNLVQIAHNVFIGEDTIIAGQVGISGSCIIGKKCLLAGRASLADHITLGDGVTVAACAGVMADIPDGEKHSGVPAMPIREHMRNVATLKKLSKRS